MTAQREAPIFSAPPDLRCSVGPLVCWYTKPAGAVYQLTEATRMTVAMASWAAGPSFKATLEHFPESQRVFYVMDIRAMLDRDPGVREVFMQLGREAGPRLHALVIIPPRRPSPLYLSALQTAAALVAPFGTKLEVINDLQTALERYQLQPERSSVSVS